MPNTIAEKRRPVITRLELARMLDVAPTTLDRWAAAGKLPEPLIGSGVRGANLRWSRAVIRKWLRGES